tara:strand:- start:234 stop:431 length:198 start_codon:yes stop_codon:yes gene_type:complete
MKSPCNGYCALNQQQICVGCGMTRGEISNWRTMDEKEKEETALCAEDRLRAAKLQMRDSCGEDDK